MEDKPLGCLPMEESPMPGDKLIMIPVYVVPVEILERNLMRGPKYLYEIVIVDGVSGKPTLIAGKTVELIPLSEFDPEGAERHKLKISPLLAKEIAKYGAVPSDFQSWKKILRNRNVGINEGSMKLAWRVYAVRDKDILDTFTGEKITSACLAGTFFS